ncbi:MAG: C1 family peptidase [Anaerolineae bacterium]|nr:C1 family peptidase [Anaerolineae bacterium]
MARKLIRRGIPLSQVEEFRPEYLERLRDLWVETVQEFVALAETPAGRRSLSEYLGLSDAALLNLLEAARRRLPMMAAATAARARRVAAATYGMGSLSPPPETFTAATSLRPYVTVAHPVSLPATVDHRAWFGPVRNQAERGTCVAHASVAVREYLERVAGSEDLDLSEQFVYWWCKERDGMPEVSGTYPNLGMECLLEAGVPPEEVWPYNPHQIPGDEGQGPPPEGAAEQARPFRIARIIELNPRSVDDIKTCLADGKVVAFAIPVFSSWYHSEASRLFGKITMPLPNDTQEGGHAMCMVGYVDDESAPGGGYFIIRNSWSPWGEQSTWGKGYGSIPYAYIAQYNQAAYSADRLSEADILIRDSDQDDGTVPTPGPYWNSPDIWNRLADDGGTEHQTPVAGHTNYLCVRVHNRGPAPAYGVQVHLYTHPFSPSIWPDKWNHLGTVTVPSIPAGGHHIVRHPWEPEEDGPACFLVRLASKEDPIQHDWSVRWDNNIAQRNAHRLEVVPGVEGRATFVMRGVRATEVDLDLQVDRSQFPEAGIVEVRMVRRVMDEAEMEGMDVSDRNRVFSTAEVWSDAGVGVLRRLRLRPSDWVNVQVRVVLPPDTPIGATYPLVFTQQLDALTVGKVLLEVVATDVAPS